MGGVLPVLWTQGLSKLSHHVSGSSTKARESTRPKQQYGNGKYDNQLPWTHWSHDTPSFTPAIPPSVRLTSNSAPVFRWYRRARQTTRKILLWYVKRESRREHLHDRRAIWPSGYFASLGWPPLPRRTLFSLVTTWGCFPAQAPIEDRERGAQQGP